VSVNTLVLVTRRVSDLSSTDPLASDMRIQRKAPLVEPVTIAEKAPLLVVVGVNWGRVVLVRSD